MFLSGLNKCENAGMIEETKLILEGRKNPNN